MKRNPDLVRLVLEHVEAWDSTRPCREPASGDHAPDEVRYHARLCREAGYLGSYVEVPSAAWLGPLTWAGHDALERMRSGPEG